MAGKYKSVSVVSGAGKRLDGTRHHEFSSHAELMEASRAAAALNAEFVENEIKSPSSPTGQSVTIHNVVYDPDGKPHPIPEKHLPWLLPTDVEFKPEGKSPLTYSKEFIERTEKIYSIGSSPSPLTVALGSKSSTPAAP